MNKDVFLKFCEKYDIDYQKEQEFLFLSDTKAFEELEFLGDTLLNFVITQEIFKRYGSLTIGEQAKIKSYLISSKVFSRISDESGLAMILNEHTRTKSKKEDLFEAFAGSLFTARGYTYAKKVLRAFLLPYIKNAGEAYQQFDYKSQLQEYAQKVHGCIPKFKIVKEVGPDHRKVYTIEVYISGKKMGTGTGFTKKQAQQLASKVAFSKINGVEGK